MLWQYFSENVMKLENGSMVLAKEAIDDISSTVRNVRTNLERDLSIEQN